MSCDLPEWLDPAPWVEKARAATPAEILRALAAESPGPDEFAALLAPSDADLFERTARRAQSLTHRYFGKTISLYVPLYLSNYCSGGCAYCGFASDRKQPRRRLEQSEILGEMQALKAKGFEDVLLLTGERCPEADFDYLLEAVEVGARIFHNVTIESFAMTGDEYAALECAGCAGVTLYQETYDPALYKKHFHRWGPKRDYAFRLDAPARALGAGMRTVGLGALLGLGDPIPDLIAIYRHAAYVRREFWRGGVMISFPRICPATGGYQAGRAVDEAFLARAIFAFRVCLPDVPLVLSTRERPSFRDGIAGVGINRMSVASRTTVGGYAGLEEPSGGQFDVRDTRSLEEFLAAMRAKELEPVFKNWDRVFQGN